MCVILQKLSLPLAPLARTFALSFNPPTPTPPSLCHCFQLFTFPFFHSYGLLEQSSGNAVQIRLWCQNRTSLLHTFGLLVSPGAKVTRGPAGQLVLIASRGLFFSGGRLVSLAAQMWGEQGISPQETSKLWPTGKQTEGPNAYNALSFILNTNTNTMTRMLQGKCELDTNSAQKHLLRGQKSSQRDTWRRRLKDSEVKERDSTLGMNYMERESTYPTTLLWSVCTISLRSSLYLF